MNEKILISSHLPILLFLSRLALLSVSSLFLLVPLSPIALSYLSRPSVLCVIYFLSPS